MPEPVTLSTVPSLADPVAWLSAEGPGKREPGSGQIKLDRQRVLPAQASERIAIAQRSLGRVID